MPTGSIDAVLKNRNVWLKGPGGDLARAMQRQAMTRAIAENYIAFETIRDCVLGVQGFADPAADCEILEHFLAHGIVEPHGQGWHPCNGEARQFLAGRWLEEHACLAALEAGADEVLFAQPVRWIVKEFSGENEIDLIMRRNGTLGFLSCKALKSTVCATDRKLRNRLMEAVHEADNLTDHFGGTGERVGILVTTDLVDEMRSAPRYEALMGKAAVLDVQVIALEDLQWGRLVEAMGHLMAQD